MLVGGPESSGSDGLKTDSRGRLFYFVLFPKILWAQFQNEYTAAGAASATLKGRTDLDPGSSLDS